MENSHKKMKMGAIHRTVTKSLQKDAFFFLVITAYIHTGNKQTEASGLHSNKDPF